MLTNLTHMSLASYRGIPKMGPYEQQLRDLYKSQIKNADTQTQQTSNSLNVTNEVKVQTPNNSNLQIDDGFSTKNPEQNTVAAANDSSNSNSGITISDSMKQMMNRATQRTGNLDKLTDAQATQTAQSRILDADMASTFMEYSKVQILTQASTATLAQANQSPQAVLRLLS